MFSDSGRGSLALAGVLQARYLGVLKQAGKGCLPTFAGLRTKALRARPLSWQQHGRLACGSRGGLGQYLITNCRNGRKYVGLTVDVTARFNRHMAQPNKRMAADVACAKAANTQDFSIETLDTTQIQGAADHLKAMHIALRMLLLIWVQYDEKC